MDKTIVPPLKERILAIDLLRGIVMIIMALDHVRDYFHKDAFFFDPSDLSKTNTALFFTRWITHFCAPVFVFLAGTSAYIVGSKKGSAALSKFLFTRGIWLIFLEVIVVNFGWQFEIHAHTILLQTIWALGVSMVALAFLVRLPYKLILVISLLFIAGHNALDTFHVKGNAANAFFWSVLNDPNFFQYTSASIYVAYPVLAWIGVMAAGYCFGKIYIDHDVAKRKPMLLWIGSICVVLFIFLRLSNVYGDKNPWGHQDSIIFTLISFLNCTKYPPSLLYLLMTIGPAIVFLGLSETPLNRFKRVVSTFGRVPMFYYLAHIYIIHLAAMLAVIISGYKWTVMIFPSWVTRNPALHGYGYSLGVVYIIWIMLVIALYPLCRWYDRYKAAHREKWWLSYL